MSKIETGEIYDLRKKIQELQNELVQLDKLPSKIPEMIDSTNVLRLNEHLTKSNDKKTQLLEIYEKYSESLDKLLSTVFDIQNELKDILKEQSLLLSKTKSKKQTVSKTKKLSKSKSKTKK